MAAAALWHCGAISRRVSKDATIKFALAWLVFGTRSAIWLLYFLIKRQAASRVVSLFYLTPAITALMAWAMFDERLTAPSLVGMAICVVGVAMVNWRVGNA